MNKKEVAVQIASKTGLTLQESARLIDAFRAVVQEELAAGGKVQLKGLGPVHNAFLQKLSCLKFHYSGSRQDSDHSALWSPSLTGGPLVYLEGAEPL